MLSNVLKIKLFVVSLLAILFSSSLALSKPVEGHRVPEQFQDLKVRMVDGQFSDVTVRTGDIVYVVGLLQNQLVITSSEYQEILWARWQNQDKSMTDYVRELHAEYDSNETIQAIVRFEQPILQFMFEELVSEYDLEVKEDDLQRESLARIVANGTARNYEELLMTAIASGRNVTVDELQVLRQIDKNMLKGEELKQKLEEARLRILNGAFGSELPWVLLSISEQYWYLAVAIDRAHATEPKQVYVDRVKELVGEDIPIVISFNSVRFTASSM